MSCTYTVTVAKRSTEPHLVLDPHTGEDMASTEEHWVEETQPCGRDETIYSTDDGDFCAEHSRIVKAKEHIAQNTENQVKLPEKITIQVFKAIEQAMTRRDGVVAEAQKQYQAIVDQAAKEFQTAVEPFGLPFGKADFSIEDDLSITLMEH